MELQEILSDSEKAALLELVKAFEAMQVAIAKLHQAEMRYGQARRLVTEQMNVREEGQLVSTLPENGIVRWNDRTYIVHLDVDGDHIHTVHYGGEVINL